MKDFKFDENSILSIWQNENYNDVPLILYSIVNRYLWTGEIVIKDYILEKLKINRENFEHFISKYINELINILYKKPGKSIILYRGETRDNFNIKTGDVMVYKNFHSTSDNISFALKFSEMYKKTTKSNQNIILVFELPDGSYYKKLEKTLVNYNSKKKVTYYINEFEYLIPPNCYYRVTKVYDLSRQIKVIKAKLILQEKFYIVNNLLYVIKELPFEKVDDFIDESTDKFINELDRYDKMTEILNRMERYHIDDDIYLILSLNEKLFKLDLENIKLITGKITKDNYNTTLDLLRKSGFNTYNKKMFDDFEAYIKGLQYFSFYNFDIIKRISNFKLYMGIENVTNTLKEPDFIKKIISEKNGLIEKILYCQISPDCYIYNCPYNDYKPNVQIEKDNIKTTQYTKYIIEFKLSEVQIAICDNIKWKYDTDVLIIPNCNYVLKKIDTNKKNKFGYSIEIYYIDLFGL